MDDTTLAFGLSMLILGGVGMLALQRIWPRIRHHIVMDQWWDGEVYRDERRKTTPRERAAYARGRQGAYQAMVPYRRHLHVVRDEDLAGHAESRGPTTHTRGVHRA